MTDSLLSRFRREVLPLSQRLYRLALAVTLNREEAEDVVQDVMLRLWEKRDEWDEIGSLEAWCTTATRHRAIDRTRHSRELSLQPADDNRPSTLTPHDDAVAAEGRDTLNKLLQELPEVQRIIFTLREADGRSYGEIAQLLNISDAQVKTYLLRARRKVRELFTSQT